MPFQQRIGWFIDFTTCGAGKYSSAGSTQCQSCPDGQYAEPGSAGCSHCAEGKITRFLDREECLAGKYEPGNNIECTVCENGKYQTSAGTTSCIDYIDCDGFTAGCAESSKGECETCDAESFSMKIDASYVKFAKLEVIDDNNVEGLRISSRDYMIDYSEICDRTLMALK